jgi:PAS domain S-box-containing protein
MRFFNSVKALYAAVGILFLAVVLGYYLDVQNQAMDDRHLEVNILLERTIRLEQELSNMLSLTVVEQNELRATRHETVRQEAGESIKRLIDLTKEMGISKEISAVMESQKNIVQIETVALEKIRADQWKDARDILLGDEYESAKKIYEIESEALPGLVRAEIEGIEKRFGRIKSAALAVRIAALFLLVWTGFMFSRRTRADLAEQMRLQKEISAVKEALEERVGERTKEAESALQKINAMGQAMADALVMIDGQGKVLFWNQAAETLFGYTASEAMGADFHEMAAPLEAREKALAGIRQFAATGQGVVFGAAIETTAINRAGETFPVEVNLSPFRVDDQWFAVGTVRDITGRKAVAEAMQRSEEALRQAGREQAAIFESLTLGIAFIKDRIILRGNAKLGELFGRPLDEMIGQTTRIWYKNEEEYLGIGASTYEDLKRQPIHQREQELPRKDGSLFWCLFRVRALDAQDISQGIVCTLEDITERKKAEMELKKRMEELVRFIRLTINREKQMIRLKEEINLLLEQAGKEQKYKIVA